MLKSIGISFLLSFSFLVFSQELKLEEIMKGNEFIGHQPENVIWAPDNQSIYFRWNQENEAIAPFYSYSIKSKKIDEIKDENLALLPIEGYLSDESNQLIVYKKGQCIIRWQNNQTEIIYQSTKPFQIYSIIDESKIIIQENDGLFLFDLQKNKYLELVHFIEGSEIKNRNNDKNFIENQQYELFEFVKENEKKSKARKEFNDKSNPPKIPIFYLDKKEIGWIELAQDLSFIVFRLDQNPKNEYTNYAQYVNESGYTKNKIARSKVGEEDPVHELYYFNLLTAESKRINIDQLPGVYNKPTYYKEYEDNFTPKIEKPKNVIFTKGVVSKNNEIAIEIKSYDNKDRWIATLNIETGNLENINHQHDETWIGGPGISSWNMEPGNFGWLKDNQTLYFQSEESGYSHLYTSHIKTKKTTQLTHGKFEIYEAVLSKDGKKFFVTTNKNHPGNREFYHLDIEKKELIPIQTENGNHEVYISPNEQNLAILFSTKNKPWELYFAKNTLQSKKEQISQSTSNAFKKYNWQEPEIITFQTEDNQTVYARIYKPNPTIKNGAGISFVHGAGYLQNAHNWWSSYYREYMFHHLLCDLGYTVIDIDYRASEGYGSKFRTSIYRHMGGADLQDQLLGRKYLIENEGIDSNRIGIYGGSYGGFITLMALLTEPGKFKCGAALRAVTDWAHYNHAYTSNILNTPETDSLAYKRSSPIYFAENLKDRLLILHGIEDDNVQFQDVVRLNQRFIELGITNFEMAIYPIEPHGFKNTSSWVDEYGRILKMFNEELLLK